MVSATTDQIPRKGGQYTYIAAAIIIAAVLISATILYATSEPATVTKTETSVSTATITITPTTPENTSVEAALLSTCSHVPNPSGFREVVASTNQAAVVCLQLYYYNSTAPLTLDVSQALSILGSQPILNGTTARSFSGASNFTVTPSQNQLVIGGPNNENEGAVVAYAITARTGASGSYWLSFLKSSGPSSYSISSGDPVSCGYYGVLMAGNGQPDYAQFITTCITFTSATTTATSDAHTIPTAAFPLPDGNIYFVIAGAVNSTQIVATG